MTSNPNPSGAVPPKPPDPGADFRQDVIVQLASMSRADWLAAGAEARRFAPSEIVFRRNARSKAFYVVLSGHVRVIHNKALSFPEARQLGPGDFFGEIGLLEEQPRTATLQVADEGPAELLVLDKGSFMRLLAAKPGLAAALSAVSGHLAETDSIAAAFPYLDADAQRALAGQAERRRVAQGRTIVEQGSPATELYVLARGRAEVLHTTPQGRTLLLNFMEPGEMFGEMGLLSGEPRTATVRAAEDSELLSLDSQVFARLLAQYPEARKAFERDVESRLRRLAALAEEDK